MLILQTLFLLVLPFMIGAIDVFDFLFSRCSLGEPFPLSFFPSAHWHCNDSCIASVAPSGHGWSTLWMSRMRSGLPILEVTR